MRVWKIDTIKWKLGLTAFVCIVAAIFLFDLSLISETSSVTSLPRNVTSDSIQMSGKTSDLVVGDLPGYTGWARPESTLAGFFSILSVTPSRPTTSHAFQVKVWCHRNEECFHGNSMFYLRAYGPSIIPGIAHNDGRGKYTLEFFFSDPGTYTVEAVLTFSNPPSLIDFPLPVGQKEPSYEGYILPGFPLLVTVESTDGGSTEIEQGLCNSQVLLESSPDSAREKVRWKVTSKNNSPNHLLSSTEMSESGYLRNTNSLGIQMDYKYVIGCSLYPSSAFVKSMGTDHPFTNCREQNIHVIFIGDSVMRVQWEMFKSMTSHLPYLKSSYVTLYGGFRRVSKLEDTFQIKLDDIQRRAAEDKKVILFNSGLHDIHRLCANEWRDDRYEYLNKKPLDDGSFSCTKEYESLIGDLAALVQQIPADLRIFQTTTAGWPKYGNYGIEWSFGGQNMPVATDAIPLFNKIAFNEIQTKFPTIQIIDGYWVTYSRPDNREFGSIGKKLSHPGLEVQSAMIRIFSMILLEKLCP